MMDTDSEHLGKDAFTQFFSRDWNQGPYPPALKDVEDFLLLQSLWT